MSLDSIVIKGAREHNLKNVDLILPRNRLIVVTGLSGSGKSSLAFDTIYAEGQRRYVESLSSYARQFLGQMEKPDVDYIEGLSPAISIDQKSTSRNPRSTVGTVTEIYDYLRLLYARVGAPHCYNCGRAISTQSCGADRRRDRRVARGYADRPARAARARAQGRVRQALRRDCKRRLHARAGGRRDERAPRENGLDKKRKHTIEVIVDRIVIKPEIRSRLADSVETTLRLSTGIATVLSARANGASPRSSRLARRSRASTAGSRSKSSRRGSFRSTHPTERARHAAVSARRSRSTPGK